MNKTLHSSNSDEWGTPQGLFNSLNEAYGPFTLDAACSDANRKVPVAFTKRGDALSHQWGTAEPGKEGIVFLNPPYSRGLQEKFIRKALSEVNAGRCLRVVCLIPARPDTKVWQEVIFPNASEIHFLPGRIRFVGEDGEPTTSGAPFPSAVVVFGDMGTNTVKGSKPCRFVYYGKIERD